MDAKVQRYYLKKAYGGRSIIARAIDFVLFRALMLMALFFILLQLSRSLTTALLMSIFLTTGISVFLFILRSKRIDRFIEKDIAKIKTKCLLETLTMMDTDEYAQYMSELLGGLLSIAHDQAGFCAKRNGKTIYVFHNHPSADCDATDILPLLRRYKKETLTIVALSDFSQSAKSLCKDFDVTIINGDMVLSLASDAGMMPDEQTAQKKAEDEMSENVLTLSKIKNAALAKTKIRGYMLCGLAAVFWPFVTGFRFYYPIIAIICFALAFITLRKGRQTDQSARTY